MNRQVHDIAAHLAALGGGTADDHLAEARRLLAGSDESTTVLPLLAYIRRIGAEQRNFRRFVVKHRRAEDAGHYHIETVVISIDHDGTITLTGEETATAPYLPTEQEREEIRAAWVAVEHPRSTVATIQGAEGKRRELGVHQDNWFVYLDARRQNVVFCQERITTAEGKSYLPWSFWSDGLWRRMEPDGPLPLWKPRTGRPQAAVMVHEGAKAARFCDWLINDDSQAAKAARAEHPWAEQLAHYDHWGWPGGAPNAHRVDWDELVQEKPAKIIQVCDNDPPGQRAAGAVSRRLKGQNLHVLMFDQRWPHGFDLADAWPDNLFLGVGGRRIHVGPGLHDCVRPAIWATEPSTKPDGNKAFRLSSLFMEQWGWTAKPRFFINRNNRKRYDEEDFNAAQRPFSDVENLARLLRQHVTVQAETVTYRPGVNSFFLNEAGERRINVWTPTDIRPVPGDAGPWLEFMEHLIPHPVDREHVFRWCATFIACPAVRIRYGILLMQKMQGVGKSTLMEKVLAPLAGWQNVRVPSETGLIESQFNYWQVYTRLVLVHEIYAGQSKKAYNKIKSAMTDDDIDVNEKNVKQYRIVNYSHIVASSNSRAALHMAEEDRRWLVPEVTDSKWTKIKWIEFNNWLTIGGLGIIFDWAIRYVDEHGALTTADEAPMSAAKADMIVHSMSEGQRLLRDLAELACEKAAREGRPVVLVDRDVRGWLAAERTARDGPGVRVEGFATIREQLVAGGMRDAGEKKIKGVRNRLLSAGCPECPVPPEVVSEGDPPRCCTQCAATPSTEARDLIPF